MQRINPNTLNKLGHHLNLFIIKNVGLISVFLFGYFMWWWVYKIDLLPGLHADEAWFGLEAVKINKTGITTLTGMTPYTGILQQLVSACSFRIFGVGVMQLRFTTVLFNLAGLYIIRDTVYRLRKTASIVLLLMLAQSVLIITSSRIAWEVNTFHLFFFSIAFLSLVQIIKNGNKRFIWQNIFLFSNILGAYNHIIFSSLILGLFLGLLFYTIVFKDGTYIKIMYLAAISLSNTVILFLAFKYIPNIIGKANPAILLALLVYLVGYQVRLIKSLELTWLVARTGVLKYFIAVFVLFGLFLFVVHHGLAFFQFISNVRVFESIYSLSPDLIFKAIYSLCTTVFIIYLFFQLVQDLRKRNVLTPFALIIIFSFAVFTFYTTANSLRYYILLYFLCTTYLSLGIDRFRRGHYPLLLTILTMILMNSYLLVKIYNCSTDEVSALRVTVGNSQEENSGHFLPNKPLIDFLKKNKVGKIKIITNDYFIGLPIAFYEQSSPWIKVEDNRAVIDYDSNPKGNGFDMVLVKVTRE